MSYVAQRRAEKQSCRCHRGYVEVEFESCGYKKEKEKSQEWELKASFLSLYFLLNIFPPWWETVGRRERKIFGMKSVHSLQEQEFVPFPGTVKIHLNKSRRNMCKLGLG